MSEHVASLEPKIKKLHESFQSLSAGTSVDELLQIIHRPGWTTIAEAAFMHGFLDHLNEQTAAIQNSYKVLVQSAEKVSVSK